MAAELVAPWVQRLKAMEAERDQLRARVEELEGGLQHLADYWNQSENTKAMTDACWHTIEECGRLLDGHTPNLALREAKEAVIAAARHYLEGVEKTWCMQYRDGKPAKLADALDALVELEGR